jgi:hypothetical protein
LNMAIEVAKGETLFICDADDIAAPNRLVHQQRYLDANPHIGVLGAQIDVLLPNGRISTGPRLPTDGDKIASWLATGRNPIAHSTLAIRRSVFEGVGGYDERFDRAQDLHLLMRCLGETGFASLGTTESLYRMVENFSFAYWRRNEIWRRFAIQDVSAPSRGGIDDFPPPLTRAAVEYERLRWAKYRLMGATVRKGCPHRQPMIAWQAARSVTTAREPWSLPRKSDRME